MTRRDAIRGMAAGALVGAIPAVAAAAPGRVRVTADVFRADVPSANGNVYPRAVLEAAMPLIRGAKVRADGRLTNDAPEVGRVADALLTDDGWVVAFADVDAGLAAEMNAGRTRLMPASLAEAGGDSITGRTIGRVLELFLYPCPAGEASWPREGGR